MPGVDFPGLLTRQVIANGVRKYEVPVGESLHQRTGTEPVGTVIGEIRFSGDVKSVDSAHQIVVDPQPTHRVMNGGVDSHRHFVRVLVCDSLVDVEQVAVALTNYVRTKPLDRVLEIEVDAKACLADSPALVANFLCRT